MSSDDKGMSDHEKTNAVLCEIRDEVAELRLKRRLARRVKE